jgi:hypothetical protein
MRDYLGISELGMCARRVVYAHTPRIVPHFSPESRRLLSLGQLIESMRRQELQDEGLTIHGAQEEVVFSPARGHVDGFLVPQGGPPVLWECKSTSSPVLGKWYREGLPTYYAFQIAGYLSGLSVLLGEPVTHCQFDVINRLSGELFTWVYQRDDALTRNALNRAEYLHDTLAKGLMPEREHPVHSTACRNCPYQAECRPCAASLKIAGDVADASDWPGFQAAIELYESAQGLKEEGEALVSNARDRILDALRGHNVTQARTKGHQVTWSSVESSRFDGKAFQQAHPELFLQFEKTSQYSKLTLTNSR